MNSEHLWWIRHLHICYSINPHNNPDEVGETSTPSSCKLCGRDRTWSKISCLLILRCLHTEFAYLIYCLKDLTNAYGLSVVCRATDPMLNGPRERKFFCFVISFQLSFPTAVPQSFKVDWVKTKGQLCSSYKNAWIWNFTSQISFCCSGAQGLF